MQPNFIGHIIFFLVMLTALGLISFGSWKLSKEYIAPSVYKSARKKMAGINIVIMIAITGMSVLNALDVISVEHRGTLGQIIVLWFLLQLFLIILAGLVKIFRLLYEKISHNEVDESRRKFLRGLIWIPAISGIVYGGLYERRHIEFDEVTIDVSKAPKLNGLKLAQLSDVHLGSFFSVSKLQVVLNQILEHSPDILVLTGDIFDSVELNDEAIKLVNSYSGYFPFGVYFCWGNHEYARNINHIKEALSKTNIKVLKNESVKILSGDKPLYILGVDYLGGDEDEETINLREEYTQEALANVPDNAYKILLAHHSIFIDNGFEHNIELTLTGHTHGGQFAVLGIPIIPAFKYMRGKFEQNGCVGYVNRGAGSWLPYRIGCPPEVTIFNFVAKG